MRRLAWILVVLVFATVGALAMNVGNIRRDALALLAGADAVAYAEPRVSVAAEPGPPQPKVSPAEAGIDMAAIQQAVFSQRLQHIRAETADRALFDGDEDLMLARKPPDELRIQRFCKPCIGNRC